jgi:quercetin dioxygenase-like cupin family protein
MSHRNASEIEANPEEFDWGYIFWLGSKLLENTNDITMGRMLLNTGGENPKHHHPDCEEVLYLLHGELEHTIDGLVVRQSPGDFRRYANGYYASDQKHRYRHS